MRRTIACSVLIASGLLSFQQPPMAAALDIPAAVPAQLRSLLRARIHTTKPRRAFESRFEIRAGKGYELAVIGQGDVVMVEVTRPARRKSLLERILGLDRATTDYVARGIVTQRRIAASFGKFGRVDVRFRPSGRVVSSNPRRRCRGADRFTSRLGVFVGSIRFSGEKHYVAVRAHRAKGRVRSPLRLRCALPPIRRPARSSARPLPRHPSFTPATLSAAWRHGVAATELFVLRLRRMTFFLALGEESSGALAKLRYGLAAARSKTFRFNEALSTAKLTPPSPFDGKGVYGAAPDGGISWTGPLSVSFPGAPRTPLTGPQFEVELSAGY